MTGEEVLFRQGQLETEVDCLKDTISRLAHRVEVLENFIRSKHGQLALDELSLILPEEQSKDNGEITIVTEFSDLFVQGPPSLASNATISLETDARRRLLITPNNKIQKISNNNASSKGTAAQTVPDLATNDDLEEENRSEMVPDAIREETVSVSGANVNIINVYEADEISEEEIEFIHNEEEDGGEYTHVVTYDVIPTTIVFGDKSESTMTSSDLPPNKHAGTIRIYKPELKSFTRVPAGDDIIGVTQAENPKYMCSVCQKAFELKDVLDRHMLMHTVVRYRCDECGRDFNNTHNLNLHKGKHDRLRSKKQAEAEKKVVFRQRAQDDLENLKFKCSHCDLRYLTSSKRNIHEKTHTSGKPYMCEICGLAFRNKAGLADHTIGHKGQRSHLCHICPAGFVRSRNLLKHIRFVHSLVQIKTVVDGKRVVEFVSPTEAVLLIEERKNNVESKESKRTRRRKNDHTADGESESSHPKKKRGRPRKRQKSASEDDNLDSGSSEGEPIDEEILQHIKLEPEEIDEDNELIA